MIEKEVKEYKQGNKIIQRINLLKSDNLEKDQKIIILTDIEWTAVKENSTFYKEQSIEIGKELAKTREELNNLLNESEKEKEILESQLKNQRHYDKIFKRIENDNLKNLTQFAKQQGKNMKTIDKQHNDQLKEIIEFNHENIKKEHEEFEKKLENFINLVNAYKLIFNNISELSIIDMIRKQHIKIAKKELNKLETTEQYLEIPLSEIKR
jgi:hypothetical protein